MGGKRGRNSKHASLTNQTTHQTQTPSHKAQHTKPPLPLPRPLAYTLPLPLPLPPPIVPFLLMSAHSVFSPLHEYTKNNFGLIPKRQRERRTAAPKQYNNDKRAGPSRKTKERQCHAAPSANGAEPRAPSRVRQSFQRGIYWYWMQISKMQASIVQRTELAGIEHPT